MQLEENMKVQLTNYIISASFAGFSFNFKTIYPFSGALQDFDKGNQAAGTNKDVDSAEGAANAEIWNEEFIA